MRLYETKADLIPGLDATDHAPDYLDDLEKQGQSPYGTSDTAVRSAAGLPPITAPAIGQALDANAPTMDGVANTPVNRNQPPQIIGGALGPQGGAFAQAHMTTQPPGLAASLPGPTPSGIGATVNSAIGAANPPLDSAGALDETRFVTGKDYRIPDGSAWRWSGRDLTPADPRAGAAVLRASPDPADIANGGSKSPWGTARNPVAACANRNNLHAKHKMLLQVTAE